MLLLGFMFYRLCYQVVKPVECSMFHLFPRIRGSRPPSSASSILWPRIEFLWPVRPICSYPSPWKQGQLPGEVCQAKLVWDLAGVLSRETSFSRLSALSARILIMVCMDRMISISPSLSFASSCSLVNYKFRHLLFFTEVNTINETGSRYPWSYVMINQAVSCQRKSK